MNIIEKNEKFECTLTEDELLMIKNCLAEVCFGMELYEFETRVGYSLDDVGDFTKRLCASLESVGIEE